jgi:hypothetical protein
VKKTGDVCLDGGNYQEMAFRTPLIRQNRRCRAIGENNSSENGVFFYNRPIVEITWGMSVKIRRTTTIAMNREYGYGFGDLRGDYFRSIVGILLSRP